MWQNRALLDELLRSGNLPFLRFAAPGHFYSPLPHSALIARHSAEALAECCGDELPGIDLNDALQVQLAAELGAHQAAIPFPDTRTPGHRYHFDNPYFSYGDAVVLFGILRRFQPARIVEIGSGHSTRFLARAVIDGGLPTEMLCIDPAPRADIAGLADRLPLRVLRTTLQDAGIEALPSLAPGDMLVIDSSHLALPGTDVDMLFGRVLPRLPAGVLVHVHDVFLPDGYPDSWGWRQYAEQMVVAGWLAAGGLRLRFASRWVRTRMAAAVAGGAAGRIPVGAAAFESSLWAVTAGPEPGA